MMEYNFREEDAFEFARTVGIPCNKKGRNLTFLTCPYCRGGRKKDKNTFAIKLDTGQFMCLRDSCGIKGNMITLSKDFNFPIGNGEYQEYVKPEKKYKEFKTPESPIIPKPEAIAYLESRGISERVANEYEITVRNDAPATLVFSFYDDTRSLKMVKYRKTDFDKSKGDKCKEWAQRGSKPILYGMWKCDPEHEVLIITEGQLDSLSVAACGIKNAVSVPTGAKGFTWIPYCYDFVSQFKKIIVFGDFEKGRMSLLEDIKIRFNSEILAVQEQSYMGCKDANELLVKHGKMAVREAIENAKPVMINKVVRLSDVCGINPSDIERIPTGIEEIDRTLGGGICMGQTTIIAGKRGDGKSTFASMLLCSAKKKGYKSFAYSGELPNGIFKMWFDFQVAGSRNIVENVNDFGYTKRFITNSNQEKINMWYADDIYLYDNTCVDGDEKDDIIKLIEETIKRYGVRVVLIDNLMTALDLDADSNSDKFERQSNFVRKATRLAMKYNVSIILVAHRRKNSFVSDANDEVSGSADITNLAGVVLSYDRDPNLEQNQRKIVISKNRIDGKVCYEGVVVDYDERSKRIYSSDEELYRNYGWENYNEYTYLEQDLVFDAD